MAGQNLLSNVKFWDMAPISSGNTDIQAANVIDMSGFDGVVWMASFQSNTNSTGGYSILEHMGGDSSASTSMTAAGTTSSTAYCAIPASTAVGIVDETMLVLDVYRPLNRYVSCYVTKDSTNSVNLTIYGLQYRGKKGSITQPTSTYGVAGYAFNIGEEA